MCVCVCLGEGRVTFRQQRDESVEWSTVVRPTVQAQHRFSMIRTPDLTPDLPPRHRHTQLWNWTQHNVIIHATCNICWTLIVFILFYFNWDSSPVGFCIKSISSAALMAQSRLIQWRYENTFHIDEKNKLHNYKKQADYCCLLLVVHAISPQWKGERVKKGIWGSFKIMLGFTANL